MSEVKERPILFSGPMVRAILAGTKTQTRRTVKPQPDHCHKFPDTGLLPQIGDREIKCPYGAPGDRLWVRETWCYFGAGDSHIGYRATDEDRLSPDAFDKWRPSIHMFRRMSRIDLEIVSVRVERLNDISEADAIAEGVHELPLQKGEPGAWWTGDTSKGAMLHARTPVDAYRKLWTEINGLESWPSNPHVWVVEFRRVRP